MRASPCPSLEVLGRYAAGALSEAEAQEIDSHLGQCTACLERLDHMSRHGDPLASALRRAQVPETQPHELMEAVAAILKSESPSKSAAPASEIGGVVGGYRIIAELGQGGMGRVFRAVHPRLKQEVALKLLRPGMESAPILARFESERHTLALMDHPHIARVSDGGRTADDRPFFVMELVPGIPVTRFCDQHRLDLRRRLELFIDICQAVQHAHQKGIIHRDLKPSNILVAEYDGKPTPKVIDFGVARAVERHSGSETEIGMLVGTPDYMSPEQADLTSSDIDTRTDIYALGALLYELLTGVPPHPRPRETPLLEHLRVIREEEVPPPSKRLSERETASRAADTHDTQERTLVRQVRGELDWIVLKALEKDRSRRYSSAAALAEDVRRFLNDEPVEAGPPSLGYRWRKFIRRHRRSVGAAALVLAALSSGMAGTTIAMLRAQEAEQLAEDRFKDARDARQLAEDRLKETEDAKQLAEKRFHQVLAQKVQTQEERDAAEAISEFLAKDLITLTSPIHQFDTGLGGDPNLKLSTLLQRASKNIEGKFAAQPKIEARLRLVIGHSLLHVGDQKAALPHLERALELNRQCYGPEAEQTLRSMSFMASALLHLGKWDRAEQLYLQVFEIGGRNHEPDHANVLMARNNLAELWEEQRQYQKVEEWAKPLWEDCKRVLGPDHFQTLKAQLHLGACARELKKYDLAEELIKDAAERLDQLLGADHPNALASWHALARCYAMQRKLDLAEGLFLKIEKELTAVMSPTHRGVFSSRLALASIYAEQGNLAKAEPYYLQAFEGYKGSLGIENAETLKLLIVISALYEKQRNYTKQEQFLVEAYEIHRKLFGPDDQRVPRLASNLATARMDLKKFAEAQAVFGELWEMIRSNPAKDTNLFNGVAHNYYSCLMSQSKQAEAEKLFREFFSICDQKKELITGVYYEAKSRLGELMTQTKRFDEAEALLLEAHQGFMARTDETKPTVVKARIPVAIERLVKLYEAWNKPEVAAAWRAKLSKLSGTW